MNTCFCGLPAEYAVEENEIGGAAWYRCRKHLGHVQGQLSVRETLNEMVLAFHKRFGQAIGARPHVPDEKTVRFRLSLIAEEFFELLEAAGLKGVGNETCQSDHGAHGYENESEFVPRDMIATDIQEGSINVDLPAFVDALADLMYVIEGAAITMGVDMDPVLDEVQRANLSKMPGYVAAKDASHRGEVPAPKTRTVRGREEKWAEGHGWVPVEAQVGLPVKRADGKILKPEGWQPPDIERVLIEQGWKP